MSDDPEFITVRRHKIEFALERFIPLRALLSYDPGFVKHEIETASREFSEYMARQNYYNASPPEAMISLRLLQRAWIEEEL